MTRINNQELFERIFFAKDENQLNAVLSDLPSIFESQNNWKPLGGNPSNYGVIENQQSNPIAALIEKLTNSIDAILTKNVLNLR